MARGYYRDQVENEAGDVLVGAQVLVVDKGTSSPVTFTLYAADEPDATPQPNPLITNDQGEFAFWHAVDGPYDALVTRSGYPTVRETLQLVIPSGAALAIETAARIAADNTLQSNITAGDNAEAAARTAADNAHVAAADPHPVYLTSAELPAATPPSAFSFQIGDGSAVPGTGIKGTVEVPFNSTIVGHDVIGEGGPGSVVLDIQRTTYANYPSSFASIVASAPPTISSANKATDSTLTGWTRTLSQGDFLRISVTSVATFTRVVLVLKLQRT